MTCFACCVSLVLCVALIPLFAVTIPPLHDYPFHLARMDIMASLPRSAFLRARYEQTSFLFPNVGMDVAMLPLRGLPILIAGRVFLGVTSTVILTGTVALHTALYRRMSAWPLLAAFFLATTWIFLYGFVNYLLGVGLMLWATAGWVALREATSVRRVILASVMAVVLLFCHLVALGLFGIVIGAMELHRAARAWRADRYMSARELAAAAIPFLIAMAIFAAISSASSEARQPIAWHAGRGWKPLVAWRTLVTTISWLDAVTLSPLLAGIGLALWHRRLRFSVSLALPLGMLVLTFAAMPYYIFGSESAMHAYPSRSCWWRSRAPASARPACPRGPRG